jgi:hypothetical protein
LNAYRRERPHLLPQDFRIAATYRQCRILSTSDHLHSPVKCPTAKTRNWLSEESPLILLSREKIESHIHLLRFNDHTRGNVKTHHCERRMSSTSTGPAGEGNAFPFNNANENQQWPTLSIIGVVLAVLGFLTIMWFIFWIFWREKRLRQRAPAGEATNRKYRPC